MYIVFLLPAFITFIHFLQIIFQLWKALFIFLYIFVATKIVSFSSDLYKVFHFNWQCFCWTAFVLISLIFTALWGGGGGEDWHFSPFFLLCRKSCALSNLSFHGREGVIWPRLRVVFNRCLFLLLPPPPPPLSLSLFLPSLPVCLSPLSFSLPLLSLCLLSPISLSPFLSFASAKRPAWPSLPFSPHCLPSPKKINAFSHVLYNY